MASSSSSWFLISAALGQASCQLHVFFFFFFTGSGSQNNERALHFINTSAALGQASCLLLLHGCLASSFMSASWLLLLLLHGEREPANEQLFLFDFCCFGSSFMASSSSSWGAAAKITSVLFIDFFCVGSSFMASSSSSWGAGAKITRVLFIDFCCLGSSFMSSSSWGAGARE